MTAEVSLNPDGEAAWLRLKQHLEWCDNFALVFLFSDRSGVIDVLRERLAAIYRARVTGLKIPLPETPDELLTGLLPRLLDPPLYQRALNAPIWLDLTRPPPRPIARAAVCLASGRSPIPGPAQRAARAPAPHPDQTPDPGPTLGGEIPDQAADPGSVGHPPLQPPNRSLARSGGVPRARPKIFPLSETEQALVREWQRLRDQGSTQRGALLAGVHAFDALLHRGQIGEAREVAAWLVETARSRLADQTEDPEFLRDLSVSLEKIGDTDRALGHWNQARTDFTEALEIRRRILQRVGKTPEALRDLYVSLNNVGKTDQQLGAWNQARNAFTEGLEIARQLAAALPEHEDYKALPDWFERRLAGLAAAREEDQGWVVDKFGDYISK